MRIKANLITLSPGQKKFLWTTLCLHDINRNSFFSSFQIWRASLVNVLRTVVRKLFLTSSCPLPSVMKYPSSSHSGGSTQLCRLEHCTSVCWRVGPVPGRSRQHVPVKPSGVKQYCQPAGDHVRLSKATSRYRPDTRNRPPQSTARNRYKQRKLGQSGID